MPIGADFLQLDPDAAPARGLAGYLVGSLRTAITDGRLPTGTVLPATRTLATDLGISRGVVVEAYRRLTDEGLLCAKAGAGTQVRALATGYRRPDAGAAAETMLGGTDRPQLPPVRPSDVDIDLTPGIPDLSAFPRAAWLRAERAVLVEASGADLGYGDPRGHPLLRHELASWLGRLRGIRVHADQLIVTAGVAQSLALLAQVLRGRGAETIAVEDPGSRGARDELSHWGLRPVGIPVDERGLDTAGLSAEGAPAVLVTPAHQFPTGVVLAPERRRALLDWAADGGLVIEDDYDAEHRYDRVPVPAVKASGPDLVAHTGSVSKTLAPGMRLGWLAPPPAMSADLVAAKHASDLGCPVLPQLVLARLLATGALDRHLRTVRARQRARRDALIDGLRLYAPQVTVVGVAAGLHVVVMLDGPRAAADVPPDTELARVIADAGVAVHPLSWHRLRPGPPGLVIGYAAHPPDRLREAARRIATVLGAKARC